MIDSRNILFGLWLAMCVCGTYAQTLTIHYHGDPLTEKERAMIDRMMDFEMDFYKIFGLPDSLSVDLHIFDDKRDGMAYFASIGVSKTVALRSVVGLYRSSEKKAYIIDFNKNRKKKIQVVYHELSHFFTREIMCTTPPVWLMEGLSEYFEHCYVGKKDIKHELSSYEKGRLRTMYMLGEVDLKRFLDMDKKMFMKVQRTDEQYSYILSHAIVSLFIEKMPRSFFIKLVELLQNNTDKSPVSEKIARVYGGLKLLESDIETYIND